MLDDIAQTLHLNPADIRIGDVRKMPPGDVAAIFKLTDRQALFVLAYLANKSRFSASCAAKVAGYTRQMAAPKRQSSEEEPQGPTRD